MDPLALAMSLGFVVVISILGCLWLGIWLDRQFNASPWGTIFFMFLGILVSTIAVYRLVVEQYARLAKPRGKQ
ncbi:MAG: AtpZ/AtpI family protein [Chloroflexi bacterium]|nr:AtpZ/AtpI family protein [Chloroflexota bacterium]